MSNKETGGSAFPHTLHCTNGDFYEDCQGMTLRDYFAAKAMQVLIENAHDNFAIQAYEFADEMIKARNAN